jgi:hypothetical protein
MTRIMRQATVLVLALGLCLASAWASGSYTAKPPRPGQVDHARYHLGKQVFSGKLDLPEASSGDPAAQRGVLEDLAARLPEKVRQQAQLTRLAGRLSREQLDALEYYLTVRFRLDRKH